MNTYLTAALVSISERTRIQPLADPALNVRKEHPFRLFLPSLPSLPSPLPFLPLNLPSLPSLPFPFPPSSYK